VGRRACCGGQPVRVLNNVVVRQIVVNFGPESQSSQKASVFMFLV
jgi:hypothetical protein